MSWIAVGVAAVGAVASYSSSRSAASSSKKAQQNEIEAQKELTQLKRQYQLEDRKYNQDAVGAWGKYLDPALAGPQSAQTASAPSTAPATTADGKPITDPNDPHFARNPVAPGVNALPINHPAPFQGMQMQNGQLPQSLWFQRQYTDYDPNNPTGQ